MTFRSTISKIASQLFAKSAGDSGFSLGGLGGGRTGEKLINPYKNSVWVMRAIKKVSAPISGVPLRLSTFAGGSKQPIVDSPLNAFWDAPAATAAGLMGRADFVEASVGWLKLSGEFFWLLGDDWLTNRFSEARTPLIIARPDRMREVVKGGALVGWEFTDGAQKRHTLLPEQVIHCKNWNPYNEFRGLSEYEATQIAAESDYLAAKFALNLNRNNGNRGEYIVAKNGIPTDEQQKQILRALREKRDKAMRGEFASMFLAGDISIEEPSIVAPDATFAAARLSNRHEIFIAFGVPPSMADVQASYSIGSASDRFLLLEETCIPLAAKIADQIERVSRLFLPGRQAVFAAFDFANHSTMQAVRRESIDSARKLWDVGMPMRDVSEYLGLDLPEFPGWETGYLPFSVAPTESMGSIESMPSTQPAADPVATMLRALEHGCPAHPPAARTITTRSPRREALWKSHMAARAATIRSYQSKFTAELMAARKVVLSKLTGNRAIAKAAAADFMFDLADFEAGLQAAMRKAGTAALKAAGEQLFAEIGKDDPFTMPMPQAMSYLKLRENLLKDVADSVYADIKSSIEQGISSGDTMDEIAARVRGAFNDVSRERAKMIAMTETSAAYGVGRQAAQEQAGIQFKEWLTSGLDNVRPGHLAADGQRVPIDQPFDVDGEELMHPGAPGGSPGNVINCHCVSIAVASLED